MLRAHLSWVKLGLRECKDGGSLLMLATSKTKTNNLFMCRHPCRLGLLRASLSFTRRAPGGEVHGLWRHQVAYPRLARWLYSKSLHAPAIMVMTACATPTPARAGPNQQSYDRASDRLGRRTRASSSRGEPSGPSRAAPRGGHEPARGRRPRAQFMASKFFVNRRVPMQASPS